MSKRELDCGGLLNPLWGGGAAAQAPKRDADPRTDRIQQDPGLSLMDQWLLAADTCHLPHEIIPKSFAAGETGCSFGWPKGMMGPRQLEKLHSIELASTSQCIQLAMHMTQAQFEHLCCDWRPCWAYFHRYMERDEIRREFERRWERWEIKQYVANNQVFESLLDLVPNDPNDIVAVWRESIKIAIAKNKTKIPDSPQLEIIAKNKTKIPDVPQDRVTQALGIAVVAAICWFLVRYFSSE
jgi:hypothetical protein